MTTLILYLAYITTLKIVTACNDNPLNMMSTFFNKQFEMEYAAKGVRQDATCTMPDRTTKTYDKTGIWSGSSYPDCNLNIRFLFHSDASGKAVIFSRQNMTSTLSKSVATSLANGKPFLVLFFGTEVESAAVKVNTLRDWLLKANFNVLLPQFDSTAGMDYLASVGDSRLFADNLALFLNNLVKQKVVSAASTIFIGHSAGAHVAGLAASQIRGLRAIIGLDPTGVFFDCKSNLGLSKTAATFVQVLHTTFNESVRYGSLLDRGHVDYYANYGVAPQPGCGPSAAPPLSGTPDPRALACSHIRAFDIFYQAMDPSRKCQFSASPVSKVAATATVIFTPELLRSLATSESFTLPPVLGRFNVRTSSDAKNLCIQSSSVGADKKRSPPVSTTKKVAVAAAKKVVAAKAAAKKGPQTKAAVKKPTTKKLTAKKGGATKKAANKKTPKPAAAKKATTKKAKTPAAAKRG